MYFLDHAETKPVRYVGLGFRGLRGVLGDGELVVLSGSHFTVGNIGNRYSVDSSPPSSYSSADSLSLSYSRLAGEDVKELSVQRYNSCIRFRSSGRISTWKNSKWK